MSSMATGVQPANLFSGIPYAQGVGTDSQAVLKLLMEAVAHWALPISRRTVGVVFAELAETWRADRGFTSSARELAMHWAYQRIIGLGPDAVPHLLRELERQPDHWFWALRAITGADPVAPEKKGDLSAMASAWASWGRDQGLIG